MTTRTHKLVGAAAGGAIGTGMGIPPAGAAMLAWIAWRSSTFPDKVEGPTFAKHRTWTHWISTLLAFSVVAGAIPVYAGKGVVWLIHSRLSGRTHDLIVTVTGISWGLAIIVSFGFFIGALMHTLADAASEWGSPLLGPIYRERVWIVPRWLQFDHDGQGEGIIRGLCIVTFCVLLFLWFAPPIHHLPHVGT